MSVNCQIIILSLEKLKLVFCWEIPAASRLRLDLLRGVKMSFKLADLTAGDNITRGFHNGMLVAFWSGIWEILFYYAPLVVLEVQKMFECVRKKRPVSGGGFSVI